MASLTRREKERCPTAGNRRYWTDAPQCKSSRFYSETGSGTLLHEDCQSTDRPSPEGAGSNADPHGVPWPKTDVPSRESLTRPCAGGPGITSGFDTVRPPMVGSWSVRKSDGKVICEHCTATVAILKIHARSLVIPQYISSKDSTLSAYLHDNLKTHSGTIDVWAVEDEQSGCHICGAHLSQLKQEAIHLILAREERAKWATPSPAKPLPGSTSTKAAPSSPQLSRSARTQGSSAKPSPGPRSTTSTAPSSPRLSGFTRSQSPQKTHPRRILKPTPAEMERWVEEQQHLASSETMSSNNGVTIFPCQFSEEFSDGPNETVAVQSSPMAPAILSFLVRAAQKLSLTSRRKSQMSAPSPVSPLPRYNTCYRGIIQRSPPTVPTCLLQAANQLKDAPNFGKVKVVLRVCPSPTVPPSQPQPPILRVDPAKRRVTFIDPTTNHNQQPHSNTTLGTHAGEAKGHSKSYVFDAAYPLESTQAEVCVGILPDVIRSVVNGADGCILCFGHGEAGKSHTMMGSDSSSQSLGVIPCAISWFYSHTERRRERTGAILAVSVSAMEVCGEDETLRDLLSGNLQDSPSADLYLFEDPIYGIQLRHHSVVSAPNAERAAFLLDAANASRHRAGGPTSGARSDITTPSSSSSSHMFFTLHVQQQFAEGSGKVPGGHSRLIMIDLANSIKGTSRTSDSRTGRPESELGSVILALLNNGNKNIPYRDSKVTMLLQESLGNINCYTTVLAHVIDSPEHFPETLSTVQISSRIRRTQKKANHSTSCSPSGRSLTRERSGGSSPFSLRAFHSTNAVDSDLSDLPQLRLGGDLLDNHSSSNQCCDTVIHVNPDGSVQQPSAELTQQGQGLPEFTPIIHSLHQNKAEAESEDAELSALKKELLQHLLNIMPRLQGEKKKNEGIIQEQLPQNTAEVGQCERNLSLKCDTFAELQERLGCIDGSETVTKSSLKEPSAMTESLPVPQDGSGRTETVENTSFLKLLNMKVKWCELSIVGEKESLVTDGSLPVDSFQREDSGLYDCEEGSAASSKEDQPNPCGSISIHPGCQDQGNPPEYSFLPQHSDIYTPISPVPSSHPPLSLLPLPLEPAGYPGRSGLLQHQTRTSPAGKSTPISPSLSPSLLSPSSSTTSSLATSVLLGEMIFPQLSKLPTTESDLKEMKATITVMVQQPLDQTGQDELVFTMVEEVTISGALERGGRAGNIIRIRDAHSSSGQASSGSVLGSLPIRIISNISEDSTGSTIKAMDPATTTKIMAVEVNTKPKAMSSLSRVENRVLPSFINPSLADLSRSSDAEGSRHRRGVSNTRFTRADAYAEPEKKDHLKSSGSKTAMETEGAFYITERNHEKSTNESVLMPGETNSIASCDTHAWEETGCYEMMSLENRARGRSGNQAERSYPRGGEFTTCSLTCYDRVLPVPSSLITPKTPGDSSERSRNTPENCIPGYLLATHHKTASLPRGWHNINKQESYVMSEEYKDKAPDVTSSTPGSPWVTLERRPSSARQGIFSCARESLPLPFSPARKYSLEQQQRQRTSNSPLSTASSSPLEPKPSTRSVRHDSGKLESPIEESSRLFSAKLEQLASRTNSLGRKPLEFHTLDQGSSLSSVSSMGSSKGSKGSWEGESSQSTLPRASRSPRRAPRSIPLTDKNTSYTAHSPKINRSTFITEPNTTTSTALQSPRTSRSKLSAVGKLMMTSPKVRRISIPIPSTKNLSFSPKAFRQSINRSASLSPDGKRPEHGPPWSTQSLSRNQTPSPQTLPPRLITKSPVRVINGRISELLQIGREPYPSGGASGGLVLDKMAAAAGAACRSMGEVHPVHPVPSPYARVTAPRRPNHLSGHASDVTSVLSGELPPAMGKTALLTNRNSVVSSGYESMVRDSEATGSITSNRDSISNKSCSMISVTRNERNPKRRSSNGSHPWHLSNDMSQSLRRSASGPRSRWVDRGISEAYEIKVYEIDDVDRLQRRGGAGKQGIACFSAKLKFLEHRQQRIEEVRAKYNSLKRELVLAKQNLMLEPGKWNQEFDLWQTFEVDSLEHLEALEVVTARLESKVNLCKANVMMVTCFDIATKRRQARRRRRTEQQQGFMGI